MQLWELTQLSLSLCSVLQWLAVPHAGHREFMSQLYPHYCPNVFRSSFSPQDASSSDPASVKTSLRSPSFYPGTSLGFLGILPYQH